MLNIALVSIKQWHLSVTPNSKPKQHQLDSVQFSKTDKDKTCNYRCSSIHLLQLPDFNLTSILQIIANKKKLYITPLCRGRNKAKKWNWRKIYTDIY